jgi:MHS family alpha-ketoglutarate permease-like MFS transporter
VAARTGGRLVASLIQIVLPQVLTTAELTSWGWPVAFAVGARGMLGATWSRRGMDEAEDCEPEASIETPTESGARGLARLLVQSPRECLLVATLTLAGRSRAPPTRRTGKKS